MPQTRIELDGVYIRIKWTQAAVRFQDDVYIKFPMQLEINIYIRAQCGVAKILLSNQILEWMDSCVWLARIKQ